MLQTRRTKLGSAAPFVAIVMSLLGRLTDAAPQEQQLPVRVRKYVYRTVGDVKLNLFVYDVRDTNREESDKSEPRAALVFFFGGGWRSGNVRQFQPHAEYLARRGMVAITADYRVSSRHGTTADKCVEDGKAALRWVRSHCKELGIDPQRIAAGGGSAGGHIAAAIAIVPGFEPSDGKHDISYLPNALVLFNPALVLAEVDGAAPFPKNRMVSLARRLGTQPRKLSPYHYIRPGLPPTIIFHGEADQVVKLETARWFQRAMVKAGNRCELKTYPGQPHGFFNYRNGENPYYDRTVAEMTRFLKELGYIPQ